MIEQKITLRLLVRCRQSDFKKKGVRSFAREVQGEEAVEIHFRIAGLAPHSAGGSGRRGVSR